MNKRIAVLLFVLLLSACGQLDREVAKLTGFARQCIDGVLYFQFTSGVTVAYDQQGKVRACK
jgi:hypothetical protein